MKAFKAILLFFAVVCFASALYIACQDRTTPASLTEYNDMIRDRDTGMITPQAIRVIPGSSWPSWVLGDSIATNGFALMSQDTSNSKERIITDQAMIGWLMDFLPDSLDLTQYGDTLTIDARGDTITISGGNNVVIPFRLYGVASVAQIYGTSFPTGALIVNRSTGATYKVQAGQVSGYTTDSVAVIPTGGAYAVLQPRGGYYLASDFGTAGDGVTDDATRLQKAINFANGVDLFIPDGRYLTTQTLTIKRAQGATIRGAGNRRHTHTTGTQIKYTGSGDALTITGTGTESLLMRMRISDLTITGTASGRHGINISITGGAVIGGVIEKVTVDSFRSAASFGLNLSKCYNMRVSDCRIVQNTSGVRIYDECVNAYLVNNWITPVDSFGIKVEYPTCRIVGGVIDNSSTQPTGQIGVVTTSSFAMDGVLFEDLDKALDIRAGTDYFHATNLHMNATDIPSTIADSVNAIIENCYISQDIQAGLGTVWKGISGSAQILWPTISGNNAAGISTITKVQGSPGSYTLSETGYAGLRAGETYTLIFQDDSVRINDEANGNIYFRTKNMQDMKGFQYDEITFLSQINDDGTITLREISRHRNNPYRTHTANHTIPSGVTGNVYNNQGASGNITLTLPQESGEKISFVASAATHSIIVDPGGTDRFRGYSDAVTFTMKTGSYMTISSQSNAGVRYWDIEDAWGNIVITSNGKGWVQGLEYQSIADSTALKFVTVRATTNYRINNNRGYQSYKSDNTTLANLLSLDASDNLILGQLDMNDIYIRSGSFSHATSGDDIFFEAGSANRMTIKSTGEVWIASSTDQGAFNFQVTGDQYLSGNLTMGGVNIRAGSGSPESVVTAVVGSMYLRTDGGAGTTLYIKESGTGNTGWAAK